MEEVFGHHNLLQWIGVLVVGFFIQFTYKLHKAPNKKNGFKWRYFWNDNTLDFIKNTLLSFAILRLGDEPIHKLFEWISEKTEWLPLNSDGMDIVITVSLLSTLISYLLHKYVRKPIIKSVEIDMHVHNENCKH